MSGLRSALIKALADAEFYAELGGVQVVMVPRQDGLLHIRHLHATSYQEEMIGVPDLEDRPPRGFWTDAAVAAARIVTPQFGAELVVASIAGDALSRSAELVGAILLVLAEESPTQAQYRAAFDYLSIPRTELANGLAGRQRERLA